MENFIKNKPVEKQGLKRMVFMVPTAITKLDPIFMLEFELKYEPCVNIRLNPDLGFAPTTVNGQSYEFSPDGYCSFIHNDINDYFIKGDIKLMNLNNQEDATAEKSHCQMSITYGKEKSELFYLKGTFKLSDFK